MTEQIDWFWVNHDSNPALFPKKVNTLMIYQSYKGNWNMDAINYALDNIEYSFCWINVYSLNGLCVKKKIKCTKLTIGLMNPKNKYSHLSKKCLCYFDMSYFREIRAENISCSLDGLFYCNVNVDTPVYDYLANNNFIEGLKIIKERIGNEDVLFEIFKKGYTQNTILFPNLKVTVKNNSLFYIAYRMNSGITDNFKFSS
jgi:hypothetical protein